MIHTINVLKHQTCSHCSMKIEQYGQMVVFINQPNRFHLDCFKNPKKQEVDNSTLRDKTKEVNL